MFICGWEPMDRYGNAEGMDLDIKSYIIGVVTGFILGLLVGIVLMSYFTINIIGG